MDRVLDVLLHHLCYRRPGAPMARLSLQEAMTAGVRLDSQSLRRLSNPT